MSGKENGLEKNFSKLAESRGLEHSQTKKASKGPVFSLDPVVMMLDAFEKVVLDLVNDSLFDVLVANLSSKQGGRK